MPKPGYVSTTIKERYYMAILQLMKYKSIGSFIEEAIREKLEREGISISIDRETKTKTKKKQEEAAGPIQTAPGAHPGPQEVMEGRLRGDPDE